ncbi:radical SAM protein [Streptomyces sp. WZ-12]|uniref:radical SAM protein n=1 Tax=Streptomyces sp. WZ-12 TaxID=3030210 RepID=UPI0023816C07|nr:radical SAM protein [Streptomyces sp. WZ-12]
MTDPLAAKVRELRIVGLPRPVPKRMSVQITNLCNSRCTMCSIWEIYRQNKGLYHEELTGAEWFRVVDRAIDHGVTSIDITGGEPFLKEGVVDLLSLIVRRTGFTAVTTNALQPVRILGMVESVLAQAPADSLFVVSVSLDGFADTYAEIRGVKKGFARAERLLRGLGKLRERYPQLNQQISFTIMDSNVDELPDLMAYALESGLIREPDDFTFRPVASGHYYAQENNVENRDKLVRTVTELRDKYQFKRTLPFIEKIPQSVTEPGRMILPCYAMFASMWIDPYGGVAPCVTMTEDVLGNVKDHDLDILPVWHSQQAQDSRDKIGKDNCAICWTDCQAMESIEYESAGTS